MATDLVVRRYDDVEVIDPEVARSGDRPQQDGQAGRHPFSAMFEAGFNRAHESEHRWLLTAWIAEKNEWLDAKTAISGSRSTRRTYITALDTWWMFLQADPLMVHDDRRRLAYARDLASRQVTPDEYRAPWTVKAGDAQQYRLWLEETGRSVATTAHYMAVASSFFQYVIDKADINGGGVEVSLFMDAKGAVRRNPFRNRAVQRPRVNPYGKAVALTPVQVQAFMGAIQEEVRPLVRARDNALFLAYLLTGRRASEIVVMQWGDIQAGDKPGTYQFRYIGKGHGKERGEDAEWKWQSLPAPCYHAIVGWLKLAGRLEGITEQTYIFGPINEEAKNFGSDLPANRHVAARRVGQLMDKVAKRAGLAKMHPHQLRHTFAHHLYESSGGDIRLVSGLLDHKSIATTQIYIGAMERKEDSYSTKLMAQLGLQF